MFVPPVRCITLRSVTEIKSQHESNCRFTFDFREVYWNSRLHSEHERLIDVFKPEDGIVADVFAGVGPFAVPAAKKGCAVLANDLNPNSAKWLLQNVANNNVGTCRIVRRCCVLIVDFHTGSGKPSRVL